MGDLIGEALAARRVGSPDTSDAYQSRREDFMAMKKAVQRDNSDELSAVFEDYASSATVTNPRYV